MDRLARAALVAAGALSLLLASAAPAAAHGFGQRYDLPVPLWLWIAAGAAAVILSFAVIGIFLRATPGPHRYPRVNLLARPVGRGLAHPVALGAVRVSAVALLGVVVAAGLAGNPNPVRNLAPTAVWILWWVGLAYVSALLGNLWALANPWKIVFQWIDAWFRRRDPDEGFALGLPYPRRLGVWPAIVLFAAFAWVELVFPGRADPQQLARLILGYSLVTWLGMFVFGPTVWLRHGDPFAVAFAVLARFAPTEMRVTDPRLCRGCPLECRELDGDCVNCDDCVGRAPAGAREWNLRPFAAGLLRPEVGSASMMVFVLLMLATVTFDGFTATGAWSELQSALYTALPDLGGSRLSIILTIGLLGFPLLFLVVYGLFAVWMAGAGGEAVGPVARAFVFSLVPIALAYHLAHYFTYLLIQGQLVIPLISDPLGLGWNLFGTARYRVDIGLVGARFAWYTAVIAIVLGHIVAVYVAHEVALRTFGSRTAALRSQYPMLVLMVGYTVVSLWIIAQPIVEAPPTG